MRTSSFPIVIAAVVAAGLTFGNAAQAQPGAEPDAIAVALSVFDQVCLKRFPDQAGIESFVAQDRLQPVPEQEMRQMLGTDPGVGWRLDTPAGPSTVTIEFQPFHTCAIRKRFPNQPDVRARFGALLQSWTKAQRRATLKANPTRTAQVGGIDSRVDVFDVAIRGIKEPEELIAIVSPLQGGSELRLVRAIGDR